MSIKRQSTNFPPNYDKIEAVFPSCKGRAIFAYGETIFNPFNLKLTPDLVEHEEVHSLRQGDNPEGWWEKYLTDRDFRLEEELVAYAVQINWMAQFITPIELRRYKTAIAITVASSLYKLDITPTQARNQLRRRTRRLAIIKND